MASATMILMIVVQMTKMVMDVREIHNNHVDMYVQHFRRVMMLAVMVMLLFWVLGLVEALVVVDKAVIIPHKKKK